MISDPATWWGGRALQCRCCGEPAAFQPGATLDVEQKRPETWRCEKHKDRNPCLVEGCTRTRTAKDDQLRDDQWICGEHWRRYVPPRSRMRRTYHAHFRRAKKRGWDDSGKKAFWMFWDALVRRVRRQAEGGHIDEAEINRIMGW